MERVGINILALVAANVGANPARRKSKVFRATFVSPELADPKSPANYLETNGKLVNIPVPDG